LYNEALSGYMPVYRAKFSLSLKLQRNTTPKFLTKVGRHSYNPPPGYALGVLRRGESHKATAWFLSLSSTS